MNHFIKTFICLGVMVSLFLGYTLTFGDSDKSIQRDILQEQSPFKDAYRLAQKYIEMNKNDDIWLNKNPRLGEATPLFMEKETPSYVEYQVVCEKNPECGFIIVNIDGDDVDIPVAFPSDIPPTQILTRKSGTIVVLFGIT